MVGLSVVNNLNESRCKPVICIMGATATGKTDAAAQLYDALDSEIVSVDSSLVYAGMDIGTAKPDVDFLKKYPHHLVDVREPMDAYSAADFYQDARLIVENLASKDKTPILAGGTMFYFNVLETGLNDLPAANTQLRDEISQQANELGWHQLHEQLVKLDPRRAAQIAPTDAQRIQRALEIVWQSGEAVTERAAHTKPPIANPIVKIALAFSDRSVLHKRIEQRFDIMLEAGLQAEVEGLLAKGVSADCTAMKMIGYRQMLEFLAGDITYDEMRLKGIAATRQLAKRQLTWLRNQANVVWWVDFGLANKKFDKLVQYVTQISI